MLRTDANTYDVFCMENSLSYLGEDNKENTDKSVEGNPVSDEIIENSKLKGIIGKIGGIGADSNEKTRNGRRYPLELWQNVEKSEYFIEGMANRSIIGEADHPQERVDYSVTEGAVVLTKYEIQDDGRVYTEFDILDTIPGRTVKTYFDAGCRLGVSSRGLGEEIMLEGEKIIDPDTYQFYCFDVVAFPAVKTARMELLESTSNKKQTLINSITSEIKKCKSLDEVMFVESMSKGVDLYLDEIKEAVEVRRQELSESTEEDKTKELAKSIVDKIDKKENKTTQDSQLSDFLKAWLGESKENISSLLAQLKESMTDGYTGKNWQDVVDKLEQDGYKVDAAYISQKPQNEEEVIMYKDGKSYIASVNKYSDGGFEILRDTIKEENNKIKISGPKNISDEDTPEVQDSEPDKELEILAELQEEVKTKNSNIESLNKQLEQKTSTIKNLVAKVHNQDVTLQENAKLIGELKLEASKVPVLESEKSSLANQLNAKVEEVSTINKKYEKLQAVNKEFSGMLENLNTKYVSTLEDNKALKETINSLEHTTDSLKSSNKKLQESVESEKVNSTKVDTLTESINALKNENENLVKNIASVEDNNSKLMTENKNLTNANAELKSLYKSSLDKYIEAICIKFNLKESTLRRLLGESYTIEDVDKISSELVDNISKMNSLPFANVVPNRQIVYENVGLKNENDSSTKEMEDTFTFLVESKN